MRRFALLLVTSATLVMAGSFAQADNWPTFRGPGRTANAPDQGLLKNWPKEGPKLLWEAAGAGRGYSSLAIVDGRMYTLGDAPSTAEDDDEYLICIDEANGKTAWKTKTGPAWKSGQSDWQSSRGTPTVDGDRVYVMTAFGELYCCQTKDGNVVWKKHLEKELEGKKADGWGYSESVLVDGDRVICTPGGPKNTMVALNKMTGEKIWTCVRPEDRGAGHASIVVSQVGGKKVYVTTTGSGAMGVQATDGKLLWTIDIDQTVAVIPTPIVKGDLVFFTAGYKRGGQLLKQTTTSDGVEAKPVYDLKKDLANKHGGVVLVGDNLYGDSDDAGIPFCADLMTGEVKWKSRGSGKHSAAVVAADGHVYVRYADGTMTLVEASPAEFKEVGSFKIPGSDDRPSWAHPVVLNGRLYLREGDKILCYALR